MDEIKEYLKYSREFPCSDSYKLSIPYTRLDEPMNLPKVSSKKGNKAHETRQKNRNKRKRK